MKSKFVGSLFALALATVYFTSCEEKIDGAQYEPIALESITFDTIPTSSLPSDTLRDMTWDKLYNPDEVNKRKPKMTPYRGENGELTTDPPNPDYIKDPAIIAAYNKYLKKLEAFNASKILIEARKAGVIRVSWEYPMPTDPAHENMYVEVTYFDYKKGINMRRNATSKIEDGKFKGHILIPGTLRSYTFDQSGNLRSDAVYYQFKIQPLSKSLKRGPVQEINNAYSSYFQPYTYLDNVQAIKVSESNCWLVDKDKNKYDKNGDGSAGVFKHLFDNNPETYFHTVHASDTHLFPFSICADAQTPRDNIMIKYVTRKDQGNGCPSEIAIYAASKDNFEDEILVKEKISSADSDFKLPAETGTAYSSDSYPIDSPNGLQYIRVKVNKSTGGNFFSLAEFQLASAKLQLMDPEGDLFRQ